MRSEGTGKRWGLLERSPQTPKNFSRYFIVWRRGLHPVPDFPCCFGWWRGLAFPAAVLPCRCGTRRGACLPCRRPALPLALFLPPSPRPPSRREGGTISLFRRGLRPRHPGIKPLAALTEPAKQVPSGGELARRCRLPPPPSPEERLATTFFFPCLDRRGGL